MSLLKPKKKIKAITVVEVLIYLALFGLIFVGVVEFVISVRNSNYMAQYRNDLEKTTLYLMNHMNSSFSKANSISTDNNTVYNSNNGSIRLLLPSSYLQYSLVSGALHFNNNGVDNNITNPDFTISQFLLQQVQDNGNNLVGVRLTITITSIKNTTVSKTITTSFILE